MQRVEPGVRRRGARVREPWRVGVRERALGILLASQRGGQEAGAGAQGSAGTLPCTRARARVHTPSLLVAAATASEPSPAEREPKPEREAEWRLTGDAAPERSCARTARRGR